MLQHLYVGLVVLVGWVFFRLEKFSDAVAYLGAMLGIGTSPQINPWVLYKMASLVFFALAVSGICSMPVYPLFRDIILRKIFSSQAGNLFLYAGVQAVKVTTMGVILLLVLMALASGAYNPFIYFSLLMGMAQIKRVFHCDLAWLMGLVDIHEEKVEEWSVAAPCAAEKNQAMPALDFLRKDQYPEKIVCPQGSRSRVLVISDSFGSPLQQYLSETFQEVVYDSSVEFNDFEEFIADYKPDIIVHLHVARFMEKAFVVDPELDNRLSGGYKTKTHPVQLQAN